MTDKPKPTDDDQVEGHLTKEFHEGISEITDMGDYALDDLEKMALGIKTYHPDPVGDAEEDPAD